MVESKKSKISFFFGGISLPIKERKFLKKFISSIFKNEGAKVELLNIIFTTDYELLKYNRLYLKHNTLTDIITFDLSQNKKKVSAEIYISYDRVKENALSFNTSYTKELHRVIFHGVLHLCGYQDKILKDKKCIRKKEDHYLELYFAY